MRPLAAVSVIDLFPPLHDQLMALLRGLDPGDWEKPTAASQWRVRDVVAHLLDGDIRRLSGQRDGVTLPPPVSVGTYRDLVGYLNELNADWVRTARRISPRVLIEFLAVTGPQVAALFATLDPNASALFPVAWAGDAASFDVGREYTERWHHQQQIREAVGAPGLTSREWLFPVLDLSMRALPFTYRDIPGAPGRAVSVVVSGEAGGAWSLMWDGAGWRLWGGEAQDATSQITLDGDAAWRLFFKGLPRDEAVRRVQITGDRALGEVFLAALAVMA